MLSDTDVEDHYNPTIRLLELDRGGSSNCGFQLTRGKWDPYPWVKSVDPGTAADAAGLQPGDCLLEVNGEDIVGQRVSEVAEIVKAKPHQVSLLLWNAGIDPQCSPEAVCCGPMPTNLQRLSACMSTILAFLECPVCLDTIPPPTYQCENGHLICIRCRTKSERCPVCRLRLSRGRSLLSDQVYNALVDAFNLKEEPEESKVAKMQQIFKFKKNKNVPDIKVTQSHTNKFLARLTGKSNSVDNLAHHKFAPANLMIRSSEFDANLKAKSLSTNEIFLSESPMVSRAGSMTKLSRSKGLSPASNLRPASCHGSFECLQPRIEDEPTLFHCPFSPKCGVLIKGPEIVEHFQLKHDGPLVQFFKSNVKIALSRVLQDADLCYMLQIDGNVFFLRFELLQGAVKTEMSSTENVLLWAWHLGGKKDSREYDMQVKVMNQQLNEAVISVRGSVSSLSSTSYSDIREFKKGVLLNVRTLESFNFTVKDILLDINILKSDYD